MTLGFIPSRASSASTPARRPSNPAARALPRRQRAGALRLPRASRGVPAGTPRKGRLATVSDVQESKEADGLAEAWRTTRVTVVFSRTVVQTVLGRGEQFMGATGFGRPAQLFPQRRVGLFVFTDVSPPIFHALHHPARSRTRRIACARTCTLAHAVARSCLHARAHVRAHARGHTPTRAHTGLECGRDHQSRRR